MAVNFEGNFTKEEQARILDIIKRENSLTATRGSDRPLAFTAAQVALEDIKTEEERIAAFQSQTGTLQRDKSGVPAELNRPGLRFDIARSKGNIDETIFKIEDSFPGSEIVRLEDPIAGSNLAIKLPGQESFVLLDSNKLATFSDFADAGGALLNVETITTILSTIATRGLGLTARIAATSVAAGLGSAIDEGIEAARGFQTDPIEDVFTFDILPAIIAGGLGEVASAPARTAANVATKRGALSLADEQKAAIRAFEEAGVKGPTVGSVVPGLRAAEGQAVATSKAAEDFALNQTKDSLADIKRLTDLIDGTDNITDNQLFEIIKRVSDDYKSLILNSTSISREQAGRALQAGRKEFKKIWKQHIGIKYDRALQTGDGASFDLTETQALAKKIRAGVKGKAKKEGKSVQLQKSNSDLKGVIRDIEALDPNVAAFEGNSAFEQIKTLRTRLFDLKNATIDGKETIQNRFAGQLWSDLTKVMDNPVGGSEDFALLIRAASNSNRRFERMLEIGDIARIAKETEPGKLVDIIQPGKAFTLRTLRRVLPAKDWEKFRGGYISKLANDPRNITKNLDEFADDPQALGIVLTDGEQSSLRQLGENVTRIEKEITKVRASNLGVDKRSTELIQASNIDVLKTLIEKGGGKESQIGKSLRRAVFSHITNRSEQTVKAITGLNPKAAMSVINDLDKKGLLDTVLLPSEKKALKNRELMFSLFLPPPDAGVSIRAAELQSQLVEPLNPIAVATDTRGVIKRFLSGLGGLTRNFIVGKILMSDAGRKIIVGAGSRPIDLTTIRILTNLTAEAVADLDRQRRVSAANE